MAHDTRCVFARFAEGLRMKVEHVTSGGGKNVRGGTGTGRRFGVACDIGTTTLACYLVDASGVPIGAASARNPQASRGSDVISRVVRASAGANALEELTREVRGAVAGLVSALAEGAGLDMSGCDTMVVAGNSVMELLFMGVSPASLGSSPFALPIRSFEPRPAGELGLAPVPDKTPVHALPLMDAFVGGDTAAVVYEVMEEAASRGEEHLTRLVMDLGTNGEIALLHRGEATVCSTAAGPAFEGVGIKCGMPAVAGAVSAVIADGGSLYCRTVGGAPARGLCGSGLVDVVALLLREGVLMEDGAMDGRAPSFLAGRIEGSGRDRRFVLCESAAGAVAVWQSDVRKFQLAKGALQAGVDLLLARCGLTARDVDECVLAGAFGSAIRHDSLVEIGLLPAALSGRVRSIGNGAGLGAARILRDGEEGRARVERLAREARHIRLETAPGFQELFLESLRLSPNQAEIPRQKPASG